MPQPTISQVHVNAPLTNISTAYVQDQKEYISHKVFPLVPVNKQSDIYYEFSRNDFMRDEAKLRAPGTETAGGGFGIAQSTYYSPVYGFHKDIDDQTRANADSVLQLDRAATLFVTQKLMILREKAWLNAFFKTGVWSTDVTPGALWSTTSNPMQDVETGKLAVKGKTGFAPNTLVLGSAVFSALRNNAAVRDQFKYVSAESINVEMLARFFDIERVLVSGAVGATNIEGATDNTAFLAGKHALLCYSAPAPSLLAPSAGYTFAWNAYVGSIDGLTMAKFRMDPIKSDRLEGELSYAQKLVATELGYFFNGAVA